MENAIVYGAGRCFLDVYTFLKKKYNISYICDQKYRMNYELPKLEAFMNKKIISKEEIKDFSKYKVLVCIYDKNVFEIVRKELLDSGLLERDIIYVPDIIKQYRKCLNLKEIVEESKNGVYCDDFGNLVCLPDRINEFANIEIIFEGIESKVILGNDIQVQDNLKIYCGSKALVDIGNGCTFVQTTIFSSWEKVIIGCDSMFSFGINIQNHDGHMIFDINTGKRINFAKPIIIGKHVWVGMNCTILHGTEIGEGSVIGACSLAVSKKYPCASIIAGNPAMVIRKNILWDRKWTCVYDYDDISGIQNGGLEWTK